MRMKQSKVIFAGGKGFASALVSKRRGFDIRRAGGCGRSARRILRKRKRLKTQKSQTLYNMGLRCYVVLNPEMFRGQFIKNLKERRTTMTSKIPETGNTQSQQNERRNVMKTTVWNQEIGDHTAQLLFETESYLVDFNRKREDWFVWKSGIRAPCYCNCRYLNRSYLAYEACTAYIETIFVSSSRKRRSLSASLRLVCRGRRESPRG